MFPTWSTIDLISLSISLKSYIGSVGLSYIWLPLGLNTNTLKPSFLNSYVYSLKKDEFESPVNPGRRITTGNSSVSLLSK